MTPFQLAEPKPPSEALIAVTMERLNIPRDEALRVLDEEIAKTTTWLNDIYQVAVREYPNDAVQLNIRRRDGKPIFRDWRHFQQIKNELIGPECEAIELYPAESRKVDTSNKYHLWAVRDPTFRFPVGFQKRDVSDDDGRREPGLRQRRLDATRC